MKIYSLDTTDFSNNGYGFLTDVVSAEVEEEINSQYVLNLEYLIKGHLAEYLTRENIIVCKVADGTEQPFRIKYIEQTFKTLLIKAYHISYDLAEDLVIDIAPTNLTGQAFGRWILNNSTTHASSFTFNSNISTTASARYIRKNVLECFMSDDENSMINKFGGEFKRDNYTITFNNRIGADNGVRLLIGKNINEIKITTDDTELYTRICPVGYNGLTLPEIYVDSPLVNDYPFPKGCIAKFEDIKYDETGEDPEAYTNINDFYDALRAAANNLFTEGIDKPIINVDIDWVDLSKTIEYKDYTSLETIRLGDTLTCDMGTFQYTTRVISTTYDVLLDRITRFQIGKPVSNYATQTNATIKAVEDVDTSNLLEQAQINASNLLKDAMTGYIYFDYDTGNLYIMDNADPDDAEKVWRWNLNGLGYSSTGINGTYGLAITMDGSIVADYITTGTLNTNVINGYDTLVSQVEELYNLIETEEGTGSITLENANSGVLHKLEISGNISLIYPNDSPKYGYPLIISNDLIVSNDIYISSGVPNTGWQNLFTNCIVGIGLNNTTGAETTNNTKATTDYISVDFSDTKYTVRGLPSNLYNFVAAYNSNNQFLGRTSAGSTTSRTLDETSFIGGTPQGTGSIAYIRITVYENSNVSGVISDLNNDDIILEQDIKVKTYPSTTLYPKDTYLQVDETLYKLDFDYLNYMSETVYDKWICEEGKQYIERNVGIDSNGDMYALDTPIIELKPDLYINVNTTSTLTLLSFSNATLKADYMVQNEYSQNFATQVYVNSSITQTRDEIEAKVQAVSDSEGEITAASIKLAINNDTSEIKLKGDQIGLEGTITANEGFMIDLEGNMTCNDANINGDIITPIGVLTNLQFGCELWGWSRADTYYDNNGGFVGYNFELGSTSSFTQSYLNFSVDIPEYFTVKSAKIRLRHSPMTWYPPSGTSTQAGSCKNMKVYEASGLGQSGAGAYSSGSPYIGGTAPYLTLLTTEPTTYSFSDSAFEEKEIELPISVFSTSGVHNIVVKSSDSIPTSVNIDNAYQKFGAKTGILTGILELIGYTSNV